MNTNLFISLLSFVGFALLAGSLNRHFAALASKGAELSPPLRFLLRAMGFSLLALACFCSVQGHGVAVGWVYFFALLTLSAFMVSLLLSYASQWLLRLSSLCVLTTMVIVGIQYVY